MKPVAWQKLDKLFHSALELLLRLVTWWKKAGRSPRFKDQRCSADHRYGKPAV